MTAKISCAGVLLAAGASRRFGTEDKLLASLDGRPLVLHAAEALQASNVDALIGVVRAPKVAQLLDGFDLAEPAVPDPKQSDSLHAGVLKAQELGASKIIVVLGDMPFVDSDLINSVILACTATKPAAVTNGKRTMPPACFPAVYVDALLTLTGDRGAAELLSDAAQIHVPSKTLHDVDTPHALLALRN